MAEPTGPRRLEDGRLLVQLPGTGPNGEIPDGLVAIGPDHPAFAVWDESLPKVVHRRTAKDEEVFTVPMGATEWMVHGDGDYLLKDSSLYLVWKHNGVVSETTFIRKMDRIAHMPQ